MLRAIFFVAICSVGALAIAKDDLAQADTEWAGTIKVTTHDRKQPQLFTFDGRISIKQRDKREFSGEIAWDKDRKIMTIEGTITETGKVRAKLIKEIKGEPLKDLAGNAVIQGAVNGERMKLTFNIPGNNARSGEIDLKLQKGDSK